MRVLGRVRVRAISFQELLARAFDIAGNGVIVLNGGQLVLVAVKKADLAAADFQLALPNPYGCVNKKAADSLSRRLFV
jgi:hypothetical protein